MRYIQTVATLCERANRLGVAFNRKRIRYDDYGGMWGYTGERDLIEVYRVESKDGIVKLYHYETLTCTINLSNNQITYIYGESRSDVDSIYTFIYYFTGKHVHLGYKPVNGGLYVRTSETFTRGGEVDGWVNVYYDESPKQFLASVNYSYSF